MNKQDDILKEARSELRNAIHSQLRFQFRENKTRGEDYSEGMISGMAGNLVNAIMPIVKKTPQAKEEDDK